MAKMTDAVRAKMDESSRIMPAAAAPAVPAGRSEQLLQQAGRAVMTNTAIIDIDRIIPDPDQPRDVFDQDALQRLADSLRDRGQLQPIRVRWSPEAAKYMIVVGERRWRASGLAGLKTIGCVVCAGAATADDILEEQLIENCLREDLTPIAQARAFQTLMERRGLSLRGLADWIHVSPSSISRALSLLRLPEEIQAKVDDGSIASEIGYELSKVPDPIDQAELAKLAEAKTLTREDIRGRTKVQDRPRIAKRGEARRTWSHVERGRVRVTVTVLADGVTEEEERAAIGAAMERIPPREAGTEGEGSGRRKGAA